MKWSFATGAVERAKADAMVLGVFDDMEFASLPEGAALRRAAEQVRFKGGVGEAFFAFAPAGDPTKHTLVVGLGPKASAGVTAYRTAAVTAARKLRERYILAAAFGLPLPAGKAHREQAAGAMVEGVLLGANPFQKYITDEKSLFGGLESATFFVGAATPGMEATAKRAAIVAEATLYARDLVSEPSNVLTPARMAEEAKKLAKKAGLEIKVLDRKQCEALGMGAYLAVAQGSRNEPHFIHISYKPRGAKVRLGLVGKGLTFDSGGISIKPADGMGAMKSDMAGSAAVLGTMKAVAALKPKVAVEAVMAMAENMPGGASYRPGDILKSMSGKTIEVLNTDAEGRLTLADALAYVQKQKVDAVVDLATLTGACVVALGPDIAGAMGNDETFTAEVLAAAKDSGDEVWQLPMPASYKKFIKSAVADVANISRVRWGGAITAGLFLKEFVNEGTPWVHLDIAGPSYRDEDGSDAFKAEGSGHGVRTLVRLILSKES